MSTMTAEHRERISAGQRARWAERKHEQERVRTQLAALDGAVARYQLAAGAAFAALERHEDSDPLAAYALRELRAAFDQIELTNTDARELLSDHGLPDPTIVKPGRSDAGGTDDDADPRRVTQDG